MWIKISESTQWNSSNVQQLMVSATIEPFNATSNGIVEYKMQQFSSFDKEAYDAGYGSYSQLCPFYELEEEKLDYYYSFASSFARIPKQMFSLSDSQIREIKAS
jgi:hypothetical protein